MDTIEISGYDQTGHRVVIPAQLTITQRSALHQAHLQRGNDKSSVPELIKVGPEGYIHGFICVRPPCGGDGPGKVRAADLGVTRDGTVVHRPSGYAVGHVNKRGAKYVASRLDEEKTSSHEKRADAVAAVARRHNKAIPAEERQQPLEKPAASLDPGDNGNLESIITNLLKKTSAEDTTASEIPAGVLTAAHAKLVDQRIAELQKELKNEQKKDSRTDIAIEIGTVLASIGLSFFTGGASLVALAPLLHEHLPDIGRVFAKSVVHIKTHGAPKMVASVAARAHTALGKVPLPFRKTPPTTKADTSIPSAAVARVAAVMVPHLVSGGMDPADARSMALAMTSHAALALRAGKKPWNNDFMAGDEGASVEKSFHADLSTDDSGIIQVTHQIKLGHEPSGVPVNGSYGVTKSAETAELSTVHRPLGTHGLWHDKKAQLPAYIQNISHSLIRAGHTESEAISIAIGAVKRWASGRGKVTPEVRAAAGKALAEWEKLKAEHSKSKSFDVSLFTVTNPDLVKVGAEGYIHGFICVRPPCGKKPGKLDTKDLSVDRDGNIVHKPSGYGIGRVDKNKAGKFVVTHSDGHVSKHKDEETAVRTAAWHSNIGKTKKFDDDEKPTTSVKNPVAVAGKPLAGSGGRDQLAGNELHGDDALKIVKRPSNLTSDEKEALTNYGYAKGYTTVNPYLHHNGQVFDKGIMSYRPAKPDEQKLAKSMISGMDSAFDKAPPLKQPIVVHRGTGNVDDMFGKPGSMVGKTFNAKAYTSTTTVPRAEVGNGLQYESKLGKLEIHVPAGSKVLPGNNFEKEIILPHDANFHVLSDEVDSGGHRNIKLAYEPPDVKADAKQVAANVKPAASKPKTGNTASKLADQLNKTPLAANRKNIARDASDNDLQQADQAFANRATKLGKDGQVSRAHKSVKDELSRRGGAKETTTAATGAEKPAEDVVSTPGKASDDAGSVKPAVDAHGLYSKMPDVTESGASPVAVSAVRGYANTDYHRLNDGLRSGNSVYINSPNVKSIDSAFDSAKPLDQAIVVHRGVLGASDPKLLGPVGSKVGKTFNDKAFVSTSANDAVARKSFAGNSGDDPAIMHITVPAGSKVIKPGSVAFKPEESELVLPRDSNFRVDKDEIDKKGKRHVYLTQLPKSADHGGATEAKPKKVAGSDVVASGNSAGKPKISPVKSTDIKLNDDGSVVSKKTGAEVGAIRYVPGGSLEATHTDGTVTTHKTIADAVKSIAGTTTPTALARVPKPNELPTATKQHLASLWSNSFRYSNDSYMHGEEGQDFTYELHRLLSTNTAPKTCGSGCQSAHKFLGMVDKDASMQHGEISRGIILSDADAKRMFQPGQTMDMPVASWTTKPELAAIFADKNFESGKTRVVIHTAPGAKGLDLSKLSLFNEGEVVTGGRYSVDKVQTAKGIMNVYVTQKDFSAH
jgi:hypothetical protein